MKHILLFAIALVGLSTIISCDSKREKEEAARMLAFSREDSLQQVINQMQNESSDLHAMRLQVQDIMQQINAAEGRITNLQSEGGDNTQAIVENMAFIQQKMREYRESIEEMQQLLRNAKQLSEKEKEALRTDIAGYQQQLARKDSAIAQLRQQVQLVFADDAHAALAQEFVVVEQAARDGIFDGHEAEYGTVCLHGAKEGLECVATDELQRLAFKVLVGGDVVEGTADALYCNLSHGLWMVRAAGWKGFRQKDIAPFQQKFPPRLLRSGNPVYFYLVVLSVDEHAVPLRLLSKVKIGIGVKVGGELHAILLVFLYYFWQR